MQIQVDNSNDKPGFLRIEFALLTSVIEFYDSAINLKNELWTELPTLCLTGDSLRRYETKAKVKTRQCVVHSEQCRR